MHPDLLEQLRRLAGEASTIIESLTRPPSWTEALRLLRYQHTDVTWGLDAVAGADGGQRGERLAMLRSTLRGHIEAEEVLFRALEGRGRTAFLVRQSRDEHLALEQMIDELQRGTPPCWREHLRQLKLLLRDHVHREETELFPRAVRLLGEGDGRHLLEVIRQSPG